MTDLYRIKALEWETKSYGLRAGDSVFGVYSIVDLDGVFRLLFSPPAGNKGFFDSGHESAKDAIAAANDHHRKEVEKMLSPVEPGWQPIETAPKDGTEFLGFWSNGDMHVVFIDEESECFRALDAEEWETPLAWQPLPPAPGGEI